MLLSFQIDFYLSVFYVSGSSFVPFLVFPVLLLEQFEFPLWEGPTSNQAPPPQEAHDPKPHRSNF